MMTAERELASALCRTYESMIGVLDRDLSELEATHQEMLSMIRTIDAPESAIIAVPDDIVATMDQIPLYIAKLKQLKKQMSNMTDRTEKTKKRLENVRQRKAQKEEKERSKWAAVQKE
eukprot:ANDGO_05892.mRNA.1 hypothetical protein